jgi:outer membrane protein OmpA-like peptidoglycan-associated protein
MSHRLRCALQVLLASSLLLMMCSTVFAQDEAYPKFDLFGGYSWVHPGKIGATQLDDIAKGFGVTGTFNVNRYFGLSFDGAGHWSDQSDLGTLMFGPRVMFRNPSRLEPFIEGLFGLHRQDVTGLGTDNGFGLRTGGGLDVILTDAVAWRPIQVDYLYGRHNFSALTGTSNLHGVEIRSGLVFRFASGPPPPPLAASCSAQPTSVLAGEPVTVTVTAANIRPKHTVQYEFRATGGQVQPSDNTARIDTAGLAPGNYTVTATVTDPQLKQGGTANCSASFTVREPPRNPPTISCSTSPSTVRAGQPVTITCTGQSPDNRPLTYSFVATAGRLTPQQNQATLDTAGLPAGTVTVTSTVTDDRGLSATTRNTITVEVPPPPPQASRLNEIQFRDRRRPSRVDNEAKAILDDVALRLQREPDARAVIVGNNEANERNGQRVAQQRAVNTKDYLVRQKGIDASRIEVRTGDAGTRSAVIWIVPQGATFDQAGTATFDESTIRPTQR